MGPPVGKSAFKLQEKQVVLPGQPSPRQDLALQPFKQNAWEGRVMATGISSASGTRLLQNTQRGKGGLSDTHQHLSPHQRWRCPILKSSR